MWGLPRSFIWFAATVAIFVLQWIPFTGIFLMFVLAPFWSIVTVNLGFISLAAEALFGSISRLWLIAPIAWFGGYAVIAQASQWELERLDAQIRAHNAGRSVAFDTAREALVVQNNADEMGGAVEALIRSYRLPVVYGVDKPSPRPKASTPLTPLSSNYRSVRLAGITECRRMAKDPSIRAAGIYPSFISEGTGKPVSSGATRRPAGPVMCTYSTPEEPVHPVLMVEAKRKERLRGRVAGKVTSILITPPSGLPVELLSGNASAYAAWFPMPVMGCALNSGAPSWNCEAGFMRGKPKGLGAEGSYGRGTVEIVARAIGLERTDALDRVSEVEGAGTPTLDRVIGRSQDAALGNLDRIIASPSVRATVHDLKGLAERPEVLASRAERMVAAMRTALVESNGQSETARNLQRLIAALPADDFERAGDAILAALDAGRPQQRSGKRPIRENIDEALLTRLSDLGTRGLPILERVVSTSRTPPSAALLGLCRVGSPARDTVVDFARKLTAPVRLHDAHVQALYVTLLRLGEGDIAEDVLALGGERRPSMYAKWRAAITPGSGPEVCKLRI